MKQTVVPQETLLCEFKNSSRRPCGLYASALAMYSLVSEDGYLEEFDRKLCQPHATKFAIIFPGRVFFRRIPMPEVKS